MSDSLTPEELLCEFTQIEPNYFKTGCGSFLFVDEANNAFIYCPYCSFEIGGDYD